MENALLVSLSRQKALQAQMNVLANNMANMNTSGYKSDGLLFEEHLMPTARMTDLSGRDAKVSFVQDVGQFRNFNEGSIEQSGGELDVALSGEGWLVVQTQQGERYTRNGQLKLNSEGQLVTNAGNPVLGEGGPISFAPNESGIEIATDGTISTTAGIKDRLQVVQFDNPHSLKKHGYTLFKTDEAPQPAEDVRILQGMIEKSNVNPIMEMTRMVETVRAYTAVTSSIDSAHRLRRTAIERLGDTRST
jgi:flagellar basal-body rod protein FlgF